MEIVIKNKANEKIYVVKNCFPYQYRETTLGLPLRSRCKVGDIYNGLYVVDVKVLSGNVDFQKISPVLFFLILVLVIMRIFSVEYLIQC